MNFDQLSRNLKILLRTNTIIAEIHLRHIAARTGLFAFAALVASFGVVMLGVALFLALEQSMGPIWAAVTVGGGGLVLALIVAIVGVALFGGSYLGIASAINTTIQLMAREEMRGKSIAFYIMCLTGSLPIGLFAWGRAADQWGVRATTVGAGIALALTTLVLAGTGRFEAMGADTPAAPSA